MLGAVQRFDPDKGFRFGSYAGDCIAGGILHALQAQRRAQRLPTVSLDVPLSEDGGHLEDLIPDPQARQPERECVQSMAFDQLIHRLRSPHRDVLQALYAEGMDTREVAAKMGVSRQWVCHLHVAALEKLRAPQKADLTSKKWGVLRAR